MAGSGKFTQGLLDRARLGDAVARHELLEEYRQHLRRLVAAQLDRRVARRVDASDIVQETLADAAQHMDHYRWDGPQPFLGWLRQLAGYRVVDACRRHLISQRRSVARERLASEFTDHSAEELGRRLIAPGTSPSDGLARQERLERVTAALTALPTRDRKVLEMWYLEQRTLPAMAEALGLTEYGVKSRHLRALMKLRERLGATPS